MLRTSAHGPSSVAAWALYREFYATPWMDWKIEMWDMGYYQVQNAIESLGGSRSRATGGVADAQERVPPARPISTSVSTRKSFTPSFGTAKSDTSRNNPDMRNMS